MPIDILNNHHTHRGFTVWLTGLSGAGKTTLAGGLVRELSARGRPPEVLDGDVVRTHLSKGLGFSKEDRDTNVRRIGFVSSLVTRQGGAVIVAAISPYRAARDEVRALIAEAGGFVEVYVECPLQELVRRDVKGLYAKALRGEIANFTGVSDPYEPPVAPEVTVHTDRETVDESVARIIRFLEAQGYLEAPAAVAAGNGEVQGFPAAPARANGVSQGSHDAPAAANGASRNGSSGIVVHAVADDEPAAGGDAVPALLGALGRPHGGRLVERRAAPAEARAWHERIRRDKLAEVIVDPRTACDLELLGNGAFSPLTGFLGPDDYRAVVRDLRLANGLLWSIPVVLGVGEEDAAPLREGADVALIDGAGAVLGVLHLRDKELLTAAGVRAEAHEVYRTEDPAHPGVRALYARGRVLLSGPVTVLRPPSRPAAFEPYRLDPADTRAAFAARRWRTVVAFQTRNPVHRAHEYLLKTALEGVDGLLLHPLVGETKEDDVPADVRLRCYEALLAGYFPPDRVLLAVLPAAMRYAGPREAIFHALIRKNYGCTHFIVGRDHAGVGSYYGTYDAQRIFDRYTEAELGIRPVFFEHSFFCAVCGGMASAKTCAHGEEHRVALSGTKVRQLLAAGESLPPEFTRPEIARILIAAARAPVAV